MSVQWYEYKTNMALWISSIVSTISTKTSYSKTLIKFLHAREISIREESPILMNNTGFSDLFHSLWRPRYPVHIPVYKILTRLVLKQCWPHISYSVWLNTKQFYTDEKNSVSSLTETAKYNIELKSIRNNILPS